MAYSFGGGVNAQLGAVDYSPFLRGSLHGSHMAGQGAAMQGQAIGQAGGAIGQGIIQAAQEYKAKQEKKQKEAEVVTMATRLFKGNPGLMKVMELSGDVYSPENQKAISAISKNFPPEQLMAFGMQLQQQQEEQARRDGQNAELARIMRGTSQAEKMLQGGASFEQLRGASFDRQPVGPADFFRAGAGKIDPNTLAGLTNALKNAEPQPDKDGATADEKNYRLAVSQGYKGSYIDFKKTMAEASAHRTTINTGDNREDAETAVARTKRNQDFFEKAEAGVGAMRQTIELKQLLDSGDVNTGLLAPFKQGIDRFVAALGGQEAARRASATEKTKSFMASEVFQYIQQLGLGSRNFDTPAERAFIETAATGDITMIRSAILDLAKKRYDEARRNVERHNDRAKNSEGYRDWVKGFNYDVPTYDVLEWGGAAPKSSGPRIISVEPIR